MTASLDDVGVAPPPEGPDDWNDEGVVLLPGFLANDDGEARMLAYERAWWAEHGDTDEYAPERFSSASNPGGWQSCTPYLDHPEILDLLVPLGPVMADLIGEPVGVHLNLTPWISTSRDWHQDGYLNPPQVGDKYIAAWICLEEEVHPDHGPFQYVPGSHRWPQITQERIFQMLDGYSSPDWPKVSESVLTEMFEAEIIKRSVSVTTHLPRRGDVLLWHSRLLHRGSRPIILGGRRRCVIAHFSGINHRDDMPRRRPHENQLWVFVP